MSMILSAWAKLSPADVGVERRRWHSLVGHGTDVAAVLEALLAIPTIRARLAAAVEKEISPIIADRLCVLAFLHDLGKANVGFWSKQFAGSDALRRFGVRDAGHIRETAALSHDASIRSIAADVLQFETLEAWGDGVRPLLLATLAHHGRPVGEEVGTPANPAQYSGLWRQVDDYDPFRQLADLAHAACAAFPRAFAAGGDSLPEAPRFAHLFAGLLSLADWIGSRADSDWFPPADGDDDDRCTFARERARTIAARLGIDPELSGVRVRTDERPFAVLFDGRKPYETQSCLGRIDAERVVVLEAETGAGKTEAALWHFHHLFRAGLVDGLPRA